VTEYFSKVNNFIDCVAVRLLDCEEEGKNTKKMHRGGAEDAEEEPLHRPA
jgi:hypothetical protein